jgi:RNA polymerase sigma-70 factor (sigma-E family)
MGGDNQMPPCRCLLVHASTEHAMTGPDDEFRAFVESRAAALHRSAYLLCGDWHLAHDLVQEALAKAYRHWGRIVRVDNPDAYVRRMVINETNRHWRRHRGAVVATGKGRPLPEGVTPDASNDIVLRASILQALLALPVRQRATVVLRYLDGLTERETAAVLNCSEGTVKSQTSRALATLKTYLMREDATL